MSAAEGVQLLASHFPFALLEPLSHNIHFALPLAKFVSVARCRCVCVCMACLVYVSLCARLFLDVCVCVCLSDKRLTIIVVGLMPQLLSNNGAAVLLSLVPKCMAEPGDLLQALRRYAADGMGPSYNYRGFTFVCLCRCRVHAAAAARCVVVAAELS